jgi:hypothetical protein
MNTTAETPMASSNEAKPVERRLHPRFPFIADARVLDPGSGISITTRTADLSFGGCYVDTINPLPLATPLEVKLTKWGRVFEAQAKVVYSAPGMGMGLKFVAVDEEQRKGLESWLEELAQEKLREAGESAGQNAGSNSNPKQPEKTGMRLLRIAAILLFAIFGTISTHAQGPSTGQWGIVATSESNRNTIDGGPLQIITDWTTTKHGGNSYTIQPVLANTFTNSGCSASGQPAALSVTYSSGKTTIVATLDGGQTVTFTASGGSGSELTGSFVSSGGGCTQADSGNFTATLYQALQGTFSGTIESYAETNIMNVTMTLSTSSTFNVTGTVAATNKTCMANLTINGAAAQTYGPSAASGDTITMFASDNSGDVVAFVLSGTDQNGNPLSPPWPSQVYVTYIVLAGPCAGDGGTDAPFHHVQQTVKHPPIRRRPIAR